MDINSMTSKQEKIKNIIAKKAKYDSYHYYCDVCLAKDELTRRVDHYYQGKDLCQSHYRELRKKNLNDFLSSMD
jgi:hypothetical protein